MSEYRLSLSILLAFQLLITVGLFSGIGSGQSDYQSIPLLTFDKERLNRLVISDENDAIVMLKRDDHWLLANQNDLPVDRRKLDTIVTKLQALNTNWPIATTASSHQRFEVATEKFQRRIQFYEGDELLGELFLGTSPGFKKIHAKSSGNHVYALALNAYEFPVDASAWLDKSVLATEDIKIIQNANYHLEKVADTWTLFSADGNEVTALMDEDKVKQLSQALTRLTVTGMVEKLPDAHWDDAIALMVSGVYQRYYHFLKKQDKYYVRDDQKQNVFTIRQSDYDHIAAVSLSDLIKAREADVSE